METQQESEAERSEVAEEQKSRRSSVTKMTERWKKAAFLSGTAAALLLAGLAVSLSIFLTKTECNPPPSRKYASTTYLGSASPGTNVTYICQSPFLFPDNSPSFTITCKDNLYWEPQDIPSCGMYDGRVCSLPNINLALAGRPSTVGLEIEITLQGPPPTSMKVDIPIYDGALCVYEEEEQSSLVSEAGRTQLSATLPDTGEDDVVVVVDFESIDPWAPYEVRLRSIGTKLAVTVLQENVTAINLTSFAVPITTPDASDATDTAASTDTISLTTTTV